MDNSLRYYTLFLALTVFLASCITQQYKSPGVPAANLFRDSTGRDTTTIADLDWKAIFTDPKLQDLIEAGLSNNLDLKIAIQRMATAQANYGQTKAAFFPGLNTGINATRSKASAAALNLPAGLDINLGTTTYRAFLNSSWEADIWGKLSSSKRSALSSLLESEAAKRAVQTQLIATIANQYYSLLALDKQLDITVQTVGSRITEAQTMKELKEAAIVNGAAVVQSEANRYAAEVSIPDLKQSIRETENYLSILLAHTPKVITRGIIDNQSLVNKLLTGLPAQLLRNRPDVQQAEFAFRGAFENTNTARTYFYPAINITAEGGLSTLKLTDFFNGSVFYNIIGGLTQPLFNQGVNKARLRISTAKQKEAFYRYQAALLQAGREVSDHLYAYQAAKDKELTRLKQLEALELSVSYTKELLRYSSSTNYTDVLTSEQGLLSAQLSGINDRLQQLQAIVNLYQALGGGWK